MKRIAFMLALVFAAISAVGSESAVTWAQAQREYQRIVIASDLHYPSKTMGAAEGGAAPRKNGQQTAGGGRY